MYTYIIVKNSIETSHTTNEVIEGKSTQDAIKKRFLFTAVPVPNKEAKTADIVLVRGYISPTGKPRYSGKATRKYFRAIREEDGYAANNRKN